MDSRAQDTTNGLSMGSCAANKGSKFIEPLNAHSLLTRSFLILVKLHNLLCKALVRRAHTVAEGPTSGVLIWDSGSF